MSPSLFPKKAKCLGQNDVGRSRKVLNWIKLEILTEKGLTELNENILGATVRTKEEKRRTHSTKLADGRQENSRNGYVNIQIGVQ